MPPYIIFSDKSLIDMCLKVPRSKTEMLNVSGVGTAKFEKYGQRFLDEISGYQAEHLDAVISMQENVVSAPETGNIKKKRRRKGECHIQC